MKGGGHTASHSCPPHGFPEHRLQRWPWVSPRRWPTTPGLALAGPGSCPVTQNHWEAAQL